MRRNCASLLKVCQVEAEHSTKRVENSDPRHLICMIVRVCLYPQGIHIA
jgi:hypothetical protein